MLKRAFFYGPCPLIDRAPRNDATSLTTYTTHSRASDTRKYIYIIILYIIIYNYIYIYTLSNYRDGPTSHKNSCRQNAHEGAGGILMHGVKKTAIHTNFHNLRK